MNLETKHCQLARHYHNTSCLCPSTLQLPDQQFVTVRAVLKLCLESDRGSQVDVVCSVWPVHFYSNMKCTHKAQKVHGKSSHGRDIC